MSDDGIKQPRGTSGGSTSLRAVPVGFGKPARQALAAFVADAKAGDPLAPVTVIVPSNYTGLALRRALARTQAQLPRGSVAGVAALEALTLSSLAERLVGMHLLASARRHAGDLVIAAAFRNELRVDPGLFGPVAEHPQTAAALVRAFRDLRDLSDNQLARLATTSERAAAVVLLCRRVHDVLHDDWYDTADLLNEASTAVERHGTTVTSPVDAARDVVMRSACTALDEPTAGTLEPQLTQLGRLAVYLPLRLGQREARLLRALGRIDDGDRAASAGSAAEPQEVPVLIGVTGDRTADAAAEATCNRLGLTFVQFAPALSPPTARRVVSATDPDEEARTVVRSVIADLDDGVPAEQIAVFHGPRVPYGRTLEEQFEAAGVSTYGGTARTLAESVYGRFALGLTALADAGLHEPRISRRDVFDLLAGARVPRRPPNARLGGESFFVPDSKWEHLARAARVAGGDDWNVRLADHADELLERADQERTGEDPSVRFIDRLTTEAVECTAIAEFVSELRDRLAQGTSRQTWRGLCGWMRSALHRYLGQVGRNEWTADWPAWEVHAAERIEGVLDRLSELSAIEPQVDLGVLAVALDAELAEPHGRSGSAGSGVYVGPLRSALDLAPQRAYIVGLAEGILPRRQAPDSLVNEDERRIVSDALVSGADIAADEHRALLAALMCTGPECTLVVPRGDLRQNSEYVPSRWIVPTLQNLASQGAYFDDGFVDAERLRAAALDSAVPSIVESPSFVAGVRSATFPSTAQEFDSASLWFARAAVIPERRHALFADPAFSAGVEMSAQRRSSRFTRFDGNLANVIDGDAAFAETMSATSLEQWASCPRRFLFTQLLGVRAVEEPEEILRLSPAERGSLIHEAIDRFFSPFLARPDGSGDTDAGVHEFSKLGAASGRVPPGPRRSPDDQDRAELVTVGRELADRAERRGLTGRSLLWRRDRDALLDNLAELLDRDEQRNRSTRGEICGSEFRFGFDGAAPAIAYDLGDGTRVRFRGVIDRVERMANGDMVVVDYKSGATSSYRGMTRGAEPDPTLRGTKLQLPVYALAAAEHFGIPETAGTVAHAAYWFITSQPGLWTWLGLRVDDELMDRFDEVVRIIVAGIRGGIFPGYAAPGDERGGNTVCPFCDPDGLGTADIRRAWLRKCDDSAVSKFAALAEPETST